MPTEEILDLMDTGPVVRDLLQAPVHARLAYVARDGSPRAFPIEYLCDGAAFVFPTGPGSPKGRAPAEHPKVAMTIDTDTFPSKILLVRGEATLESVTGIPDEDIESFPRFVGEDQTEACEASVQRETDRMVLITIVRMWINVIDFVTRFPGIA